jgi:hypothetical protein
MLTAEPNRAKERRLIALARCKKSSTASDDPNLEHPWTLRMLPNAQRARKLNELPR